MLGNGEAGAEGQVYLTKSSVFRPISCVLGSQRTMPDSREAQPPKRHT